MQPFTVRAPIKVRANSTMPLCDMLACHRTSVQTPARGGGGEGGRERYRACAAEASVGTVIQANVAAVNLRGRGEAPVPAANREKGHKGCAAVCAALQ